ncbi:MAG: YybS family protein [Hyphomicrobiales bacterium]|nr:YybS family protein [Hyphomicrobiales bacterium]
MASPLLIGLGAGLVAAVLFASAATGSVLALALFYLAPLPGFLAGLGWGSASALTASLSGAAVATAALGAKAGTVFLLTLGLPITVLCYLALLSRGTGPAAAGDTGTGQGQIEWYPAGRIVAWATLMAGGLSGLSVPMVGLDAESYRAAIQEILDKTILDQLGANAPQGLDKEALTPLINLLVRALPAATAILGLGVMLFNLWAAGRIVDVSGRALRPWPDLSTMTYPNSFALFFVVSLLLTFSPGLLGIIATGFTGAFLLAYVLLGLVVLHKITLASSLRPFLLFILYFGILFFGWIALVVAIVGIGEPVFKLRERIQNKPQPPSGTGG